MLNLTVQYNVNLCRTHFTRNISAFRENHLHWIDGEYMCNNVSLSIIESSTGEGYYGQM